MLTEAGEKFGSVFNENIGFSYLVGMPDQITLDDVYGNAYDSIIRMLFADAGSNYGHAESLAGVTGQDWYDDYQQYLGVGVDNWGDTIIEVPVKSNNASSDALTIDTGASYSATPNVETLQNNLTIAKQNLTTTQATLTQDQNKFSPLNDKYQAAKAALESAKNNLSTAKAQESTASKALVTANSAVASAQAKVSQAKEKVATAEANVSAAKAVLANLNSDQANKLAALKLPRPQRPKLIRPTQPRRQMLPTRKPRLQQLSRTLLLQRHNSLVMKMP